MLGSLFNEILIRPIFNLMALIYSIVPGRDFGVAIIIFTIIVRLLMWPLLRKQFRQVRAIQKLQPELARIKRETKGDKRAEQVQVMELYKKSNVNPFGSLGVLIVQLPIFIALYSVIRIFTSSRGEIAKFTYDFLKGLGPIKDLIADPSTFNQKFLGFLDLSKAASGKAGLDIILIILVVISAFTQYYMSKQTMANKSANRKTFRQIMAEASQGKQADQAELNAIMNSNMTKIMPLMMMFIMINLPGAIVLYYTVSNIVAIFQQRYLLEKGEDKLEDIVDKMPDEKLTTAKPVKPSAAERVKKSQEAKIIRISAKDKRGRK